MKGNKTVENGVIIGGLPFISKGFHRISVAYTNHNAYDKSVSEYGFETLHNTKTMQMFYWSQGRSWNGDVGAGSTVGYCRFSGSYLVSDSEM